MPLETIEIETAPNPTASVIVPRVRFHGYRDRMTDAIAHLRAADFESAALDGVEHLVVIGVGLVGELGRDLGHLEVLAEVVLVDDRLHLDEVDDAGVRVLLADRKLDRDGVCPEPVDHRLHALHERVTDKGPFFKTNSAGWGDEGHDTSGDTHARGLRKA